MVYSKVYAPCTARGIRSVDMKEEMACTRKSQHTEEKSELDYKYLDTSDLDRETQDCHGQASSMTLY